MRATSAILIAALALAATSTDALAAKPAAKAAGPVKAGSPTVTDDVRCLLTMVAFSNLNKDHSQAAQAAVFFFAGRISARAPTLDLAAAVRAQAPTLGPQQLQGELQRCGPMVDGASHRFMAAVNGLRPQGAAAPAAAPAPGPLAPLPK